VVLKASRPQCWDFQTDRGLFFVHDYRSSLDSI
jgi:hypothetical protein